MSRQLLPPLSIHSFILYPLGKEDERHNLDVRGSSCLMVYHPVDGRWWEALVE